MSCLLGELEQTMGKGFYLGSHLRRYARSHQFGASDSSDLKEEILGLMNMVEEEIGSNIKGTLVSDVFQLVDSGEREGNTGYEAIVEDDWGR